MILSAISFNGKEGEREAGDKIPRQFLEPRFLSIRKTPYSITEKISAFRRLNMYLSREQAMKLCSTVIILSFKYCSLVWMFCGKEANHKINRTHKRALRIPHNDYDSSLNTLLKKSDTVSIHIKNLQKLMLEIYKSMNHLNPSYIWHSHEKKEIQYDLRTKHLCKLQSTKTIKFGMESFSFRGSILWNNLTMK